MTQPATLAPDVQEWSDLGRQLWQFLTNRDAALNYQFDDVVVEVPRDTGEEAPRSTWRINGTLSITTSDNEARKIRAGNGS